jgi:hypothetical protein
MRLVHGTFIYCLLPIELAHEARAVFNVLKNKMILGTDDCLTGVVAIMSVQVLCCEGVDCFGLKERNGPHLINLSCHPAVSFCQSASEK